MNMNISVIIPTLNEEVRIAGTINQIRKRRDADLVKEIIIVDGGSTDETVSVAELNGATVINSDKGRAVQMNMGAECASGDIFYFLHADCIPPAGFDDQIIEAVRDGHPAGCFQLAFDDSHFLLRVYAWFTRFDVDGFRFGDQSLFITRALFERIDGFREDHLVMEDNELVRRIKRGEHPFCILSDKVITSARKYRDIGILRLQLIFGMIFLGYHLGISQSTLATWYKKLV